MALLFMDSFDHYATADIPEKWTTFAGSTGGGDTSGIISGAGRRGGGALRLSSNTTFVQTPYAQIALAPTGTKMVVGFGFTSVTPFSYWVGTGAGNADSGNVASLFNVRNGGSSQMMIALNNDGTLQVWRSHSSTPVLLGTTPVALVQAVYTYIEIAIVFDAAVGSVVIRFNGNVVLNVPNVNTIGISGVAAWNMIRLGPFRLNSGVPPEVRYDDLYVLDGSGAAPWNTFLGDCRVEAMLPSGAGANTGWTPSAGANWQCVDDAAPNDDTDYTAASTVGLTDTFVTPDLLVAGSTVFGVQQCLSAKKADAGLASIAPVIRHGGADYAGVDLNPNTGYNVLTRVAQVNPGTGAQWTMADFNAAEFGYRRTV